jgi:hypothetical protein
MIRAKVLKMFYIVGWQVYVATAKGKCKGKAVPLQA